MAMEEQKSELGKLSKEEQRMAKEREREEQRAKKAEILAKKEQARAEKETIKQEREAERERKRQAKEEAEKKKNAVIQKQAGIMNKLFVKQKPPSPPKATPEQNTPITENTIVSAMDRVLSASHTETSEWQFLRTHLDLWKNREARKRKVMTWGLRRQPKVDVFREPRLQRDTEAIPSELQISSSQPNRLPRMKLLQFHKCFRPAYYGTHSKPSNVVGPRHPLRKEPSLNYEVDSDDEWEEECPGESLSDCDEPEEEEKMDEDESGDDFVVPDGYFSADEGVDMETSEKTIATAEVSSIDKVKNILDTVNDRALKINCPFILQNFSTNSSQLDPDNVAAVRDSCLKALEIRILADDIRIEPVQKEDLQANQDVQTPVTSTRGRRKIELADSALPEIVQFLQESPSSQGMKKIVESLSQRFPGIPKTTLTSKVREISCYTDNHWKVKDEVLLLLQPQKKICLGSSDADEQGQLSAPCRNAMQKRCLPVMGT